MGYPFHFVVTATTRSKRPGEEHGQDYFFISMNEFTEMIEQDELLEYAVVYGDYKGIPKAQVRQALASGKDVILRLDVQGAETIRRIAPQAVLIYLSAESEEALAERLRQRKTESEAQLAIRLATARQEQEKLVLFDYLVCNCQGELDETCKTIAAIIKAERCRVDRPEVKL
jgi:guanylate kinase